MRHRARPIAVLLFGASVATASLAAEAAKAVAEPITSVALPGAAADGVRLDYLAIDRGRHQVWVPAGGTGNAIVIDTKTQAVRKVEHFPTKEVERNGQKRIVGLSSATVGDGVVYVGNRADSSVCAVDAKTLERRDCLTLPSSPDGIAFVASKKEVWVTAPHDKSIVILDVATPGTPKLVRSLTLEGDPEGYAVDDKRGLFYTNLEDKDRTLRIDVATRTVTATWLPSCGEAGPRGIAIEPSGRWLMVACTDHVEVLSTAADGAIVSKLDTGEGVDSFDYVPDEHSLYVAAGGAARLTVAHLDEKGVLQSSATFATAKGARNAVATDDGTAYVADGPEGRILVVRTKPKS